ncbi:hypothetical protein ACU4GR_00895 [Methylobacterium oryzae CBMB20]
MLAHETGEAFLFQAALDGPDTVGALGMPGRPQVGECSYVREVQGRHL